jgi:hypothetical protein
MTVIVKNVQRERVSGSEERVQVTISANVGWDRGRWGQCITCGEV